MVDGGPGGQLGVLPSGRKVLEAMRGRWPRRGLQADISRVVAKSLPRQGVRASELKHAKTPCMRGKLPPREAVNTRTIRQRDLCWHILCAAAHHT